MPFLKIDAEGNSSWQFYDYKNNIFFGKIFEDHRKLEREIQAFLIEKTTYLWKTEYYKENIGLKIR